jgi:hypothetical protein
MPAPLSSNPSSTEQSVPLSWVVDLLTPALGREKAQEVVVKAATNRGYFSDPLTMANALDLLTILSSEPAMLGVCARFARMRLVFRPTKVLSAE